MNELFTIGHSNHSIERFVELSRIHGITAIGDVRSSPYSRFNPQFNRENLQKALRENGIWYVFLGEELGPRSENPSFYVDGRVQYDRLARTEVFARGIERIRIGIQSYRIALMCAEKDPITCHRMILVCRSMRLDPVAISHILEDGSLETLNGSERRLLRALKMPQLTLFDNEETLIQRAYDAQGQRIAYRREDDEDVRREQAEGAEE